MKYTYILFILLFILSSCGNGDCTYTHDAKEWSEEWSEDYEIFFEGEGYNRDNNEVVIRKHNGKEITGSYCSFDSKGRQVRKENYLNGKLNGLVLRFDKRRGIVEDTTTYENGYKEGRDVNYVWSDNLNKHTLYYLTTYSKNLKNGFHVTNFQKSEQISKTGNYKNDRLDGYWEHFHQNGKIERKMTFKDGLPIKLHKEYEKDGKIVRVKEYVESENGTTTVNEWRWSQSAFGKEVWSQVKKDGKYIYFNFDREGNLSTDAVSYKENKNLVHYDFDGYSDWTVEGYSY